MYIVKRKDNIRLILEVKDYKNYDNVADIIISVKYGTYKVQVKFLWFWITIKEFSEHDYYDALECYQYCTNPYKLK